jgi:hypothetical protein
MRQVSSKKVKPTPGIAAHLGDGSGGFLTFPVKKSFSYSEPIGAFQDPASQLLTLPHR